MTAKYKVFPFVFNHTKFASDCRHKMVVGNLTRELVASHAGITESTITYYLSGQEDNMKMQNFLAVCNALDLNPLNYFDLGEVF